MAKRETSPELTEEFKKTLAMTKILDVEVNDELKKSFIAYAMAVNKSRHSRCARRLKTGAQKNFIFYARNGAVQRKGLSEVRPYRRRRLG